jgi:hypothetical protein
MKINERMRIWLNSDPNLEPVNDAGRIAAASPLAFQDETGQVLIAPPHSPINIRPYLGNRNGVTEYSIIVSNSLQRRPLSLFVAGHRGLRHVLQPCFDVTVLI